MSRRRGSHELDPVSELSGSNKLLYFQSHRMEEENFDGAEIDIDHIENVPIEHFEKEPFYYEADDTKRGYKNKHNANLFANEAARPTLAELVRTCTETRDSTAVLFEQGMWVEYRSNDMKWKVGLVNRVVKQAPDSWDFDVEKADPPEEKLEISYNVGVEGLMAADNVRAPELGLKFIFGCRPWLWQQFTLLQLERRLRFDEGHEHDFEQVDNLKFATVRFEAWLNAPENADFKELYEKKSPMTQNLLKTHLFTPFDLLDFMCERPEEWNFKDSDINVYTYLSVLGSGVTMAFIAFAVQMLTPFLLLYNNVLQSDGSPTTRFFVDPITDLPLNGEFLPTTDFETFCNNEGREEGKILIILVMFIYLASVVPDSILGFYRTSGGAKGTYSRINSLRYIIWEQNDDDIQQQIGFKLDRLMNTGYVAFLYSVQLFILLNTPLVLDVILNALAIEFIHQIDESLANSDWWDEDSRWLKAGSMELVMQAQLRLRLLENAYRLCEEFDIDEKAYRDAVGGMKPLADAALAKKDDASQKYMSKKERTYAAVAVQADKLKNDFVQKEYRKQIVQFGVNGHLAVWFGLRTKGVFHRYLQYRCWSRWEKVLFLPSLPEPEVQEQMLRHKHAARVTIGRNDYSEFISHIFWVLTFRETIVTSWDSLKHGNFLQVPLKIVLGFFEWLFYMMQLIFPFIVLFCLFFIPYCY